MDSIDIPTTGETLDLRSFSSLGERTTDQTIASRTRVSSLKEVSKVFDQHRRPVRALDDLNLEVFDGEFVAIVGASGCGKSTLLKLVAGLLDPTEGRIDQASELEHPGKIGMVFQAPVLLPWRSVLANVMLPTEILNIPNAREAASALIREVGLGGFESYLPYQLSGGMEQRVAICRALLSDPLLLLMDEPFGALDAITRERMNLLLQDIWAKRRQTVLFVTHSIDEAVFLSDRIVVMTPRPGRIAKSITNALERPRNLETFNTPLFSEYAAEIRRLIVRS